jgi:hypothetical protein
VDVDERAEGVEVDTGIAVATMVRWISSEMTRISGSAAVGAPSNAGGIKEAEGHVEGFTEASVVVIADFPGMYDDADADLFGQASSGRTTGVVAGQEPAERGDDAFSTIGLEARSTGWIRARRPSPRSVKRSR